jgi:membrane-bound ClpP family serine protease
MRSYGLLIFGVCLIIAGIFVSVNGMIVYGYVCAFVGGICMGLSNRLKLKGEKKGTR